MNRNIQDIADAAGILKAHKHHALAEKLIQIAESMVDHPNIIRMEKEIKKALDRAGKYRHLLDIVRTERDQIIDERDALKKQIYQLKTMNYYQAIELLNRVRKGDKTPTRDEIDLALLLTGDIDG